MLSLSWVAVTGTDFTTLHVGLTQQHRSFIYIIHHVYLYSSYFISRHFIVCHNIDLTELPH